MRHLAKRLNIQSSGYLYKEEGQIRIWRLGPDRADEWRHIRLEMLRESSEAFGTKLEDWENRPLADFIARVQDVSTFAAGRAIGQPLAVAAWQEKMDPRDLKRGWLFSVYARPEARGQGFAEAVIRAALADAKAAGMTSVGLNVVSDNRSAQALYTRLGFVATGRPGVTSEQGVPETEMIVSLPA